MKNLLIGGLILLVVGAASIDERVRRFPQSLSCQLWGIGCEPTRLVPLDTSYYAVPRTVGAWSQYNDMSEGPLPWWRLSTGRPFHETMSRHVDVHGLSAVGFGLRAHPTINYYENIRKAMRTPGIDIIVLWLEFWSATETDCDGNTRIMWQDYPDEVFNWLYETYGQQEKAVFLMTFESDTRIYPSECNGGTAQERMDYMLYVFNKRQAASMAARQAHPHAKLRVFFAVEVDQYGFRGEDYLTARDIIPRMDVSPDFIGLSLWPNKSNPALEAYRKVQEWTGLPNYRMFVAEVGAREHQQGDQYSRIMEVVPGLFDQGLAFALVWSLEQSNLEQQTLHALADPDTGEYRSGMQAIREINDVY